MLIRNDFFVDKLLADIPKPDVAVGMEVLLAHLSDLQVLSK